MVKSGLKATVGVLVILMGFTGLFWLDGGFLMAGKAKLLPSTLSGAVVDANGPIAGAVIQIMGLPEQITSDQQGMFTLSGLGGLMPITITAWSHGYYVGWARLDPKAPDFDPEQPVTITIW